MDYIAPKLYLPRPDRFYRNFKFREPITEANLDIIKNVLAEYDLELTKMPMPRRQRRSYSLTVDTTQSKKIFKQYNNTLARSNIIHEHSILMYLAQVNFPAPRLVVKNTGETLVQQNNYNYALFEFIEGGFHYHNYLLFPWQTQKFIKIGGEMLALLHDTLKDFVPAGNNLHGFKPHTEERWRDLDWFLSRLADCVRESSHPSQIQPDQVHWLLRHAKVIEETLPQLDAELKQAALARTIIHADYGPYNLLFRKNAPVVILDFELARLDWRVLDLVMSLYRFAYSKKSGLRFNQAKWFLDAYQNYSPFTSDELQLIPVVWKFWSTCRCITSWNGYCNNGDKVRLANAKMSLEMAEWMLADQANFINRLNLDKCGLNKPIPHLKGIGV